MSWENQKWVAMVCVKVQNTRSPNVSFCTKLGMQDTHCWTRRGQACAPGESRCSSVCVCVSAQRSAGWWEDAAGSLEVVLVLVLVQVQVAVRAGDLEEAPLRGQAQL